MGPHLHEGMGIFKRFSKLNTLNLLYMQAELMNLEQELKVLAYIDTGIPDRQTFAISVRDMKQSPDSTQWRKVIEVRNMLRAYNKALREQAELSKMRDARDHDRDSIDHWIRIESGGDKFLSGCEARPWMPGSQRDLLSLSSRSTDDLFTRWIEEHVLPWLHWLFFYPWKKPMKGEEATNITHYGKAGLKRMARALQGVLSTLLPSLAVLALYHISDPIVRLGAIAAFSAAFSLVLALFTKARPIEMFAATAA
ncbi:hypothetical protein K458DRAFT_297185 [Lentithecium fluviatile CBS 122367]|uniref:DUF6594 domain-containing protein n=1 Tax=Lentithecium fluviatile CBS 122367 TaxID=1168545 RepID=A0A6G1J7Y8_9PLEO|nr:hypothetical protein K458DRAFT_297185 [Lentithecium fluviatile CBS 122367]